MQDRAGAWWEGEKREGDAVLADEGFKRTANGMQLAYDEKDGVLRESTKAALNSLMPGMVPSEHWRREGTWPREKTVTNSDGEVIAGTVDTLLDLYRDLNSHKFIGGAERD
ncbi:hypothetical protein CC1G_15715 [Coprinopsis cinerea okayama7|uniref:Uncharacterized protein n=1 Tax=Coprinopsis cinerea (strain Okayama-7 / 130 / ATCC MYA-4618 / FGSC 9003) TaxID=240176 RepID=D6RQH6_COPC7|nr:hypothetical protein CC1G_15715 [Coprinopsis cinerea okayama7\|eukprot:XP_002910286.1 hypothetical protein CC1G_15715 [Coprinopsis cinerea okayama7\